MDKTNHKRLVTAIAVLTASITTASVAWKSDLWFIIIMKALEGVAATIFLPALMSLLLGICESPEVCQLCGFFDFAVGAQLEFLFRYQGWFLSPRRATKLAPFILQQAVACFPTMHTRTWAFYSTCSERAALSQPSLSLRYPPTRLTTSALEPAATRRARTS